MSRLPAWVPCPHRGVPTAALLALGWMLAAPAAAQTGAPAAPRDAPSKMAFLSEYRFHLDAAGVPSEEARFGWIGEFGGDVDLVDYQIGRIRLGASYEVILGREFRSFDPNQGIYTFDLSASRRVRSIELAGVLHHVSRHASDRAQRFGISWNTIGASATRVTTTARTRLLTRGRWSWVVTRAFVDYRWEGGATLAARAAVSDRWAVVAAGDVTVVGVSGDVAGRGAQVGARAEGGLRVTGSGGALEAFLAYERRIDAGLLDRRTRNWAVVGIRLVSGKN